MNALQARQWLDQEWLAALSENQFSIDPPIDRLVNSKVVAVRYALVTQLLGKIANPERNTCVLQLADGSPGAWDARSFSTAVVVPWVAENQHVLGTSVEPYASKPLRRERLEHDMSNVRNKLEWNALVSLLEEAEQSDEIGIREIFKRVLFSLVRRLSAQDFEYAIPQRISLYRLRRILEGFLSAPSGGSRPLATTAALMRTVGDGFSLFSRVESQGINEADAAKGVPGDVICYDRDKPNQIRLVVEVKDLELTLGHIDASSLKAKKADVGLANVVFAVPGIRESLREEISARIATEWASGMNIYAISLQVLVDALFILLDESWRVRLVREIGDELDRRQDQGSRKAWYDLLLTAESEQ